MSVEVRKLSIRGKNKYMFSAHSLCLISQEKKKYADKALIAEGHMWAVMGPQLAELACRFVILLLQWAFKNHPEMVSHFSHLEKEKLHQISNTVQCDTGPILQAWAQPSCQQQAPLFPVCPSESVFLLISAKACCCLLSLSAFLLQGPHSRARSHSGHPSLLLMLRVYLQPQVAAQGQSCSSLLVPPKQSATATTARQIGDALPCFCRGRAQRTLFSHQNGRDDLPR